LLDLAIVTNRHDLAVDAAEWIVAEGGVSPTSLMVANGFLGGEASSIESEIAVVEPIERIKRIARYRRHLRTAPYDAISWTDLALEHSILGNTSAALRAMRIATSLAPSNRFVVRAGCRLYLHNRDYEQAHDLALRGSRHELDPWMIAAEIVSAGKADRTPRSLKLAKQLLNAGTHSPHHLSELASAVGTLEFTDGSLRTAKKRFRQALEAPTENSVAQAAWFSRHAGSPPPPPAAYAVPLAFEAQALQDLRLSQFPSVVQLSLQWQQDEPFAMRPAHLGAWVASTGLGDHSAALRLIAVAEQANPGDADIVARRFYSEASTNQLEKASATLDALETMRTEGRWTAGYRAALLHADHGLLAFRKGDSTTGTVHYRQAIAAAASASLHTTSGLAILNFAFEAARVGIPTDLSDEALTRAASSFDDLNREVVNLFVQRIRQLRALRAQTHNVSGT
jgi:tetratricopeptide (TPR) repeat protein